MLSLLGRLIGYLALGILLCPPSYAEVMCMHAWLCNRLLEIQTQVLMFAEQMLIPTGPSPQLMNFIFLFADSLDTCFAGAL